MKNIVVSIGLLASAMFSFCQEEYLKGTDFWTTDVINSTQSGVSWLPIPDSCVLYIYGDSVCTGYVENPCSGFYRTFSVSPGMVTRVTVPGSEMMFPVDYTLLGSMLDSVMCFGIHIVTTREVSVRQLVRYLEDLVEDYVLPTRLYGTAANYSAYYNNSISSRKVFVAIATENNTELFIRLSNGALLTHRVLQKGEVLLYATDPYVSSDAGYNHYTYIVESNCKTFKISELMQLYGKNGIYLYTVLHSRWSNAACLLNKRYQNILLYKHQPIIGGSNYQSYTLWEMYDGMNAIWTSLSDHPSICLGVNVYNSHNMYGSIEDADYGFSRVFPPIDRSHFYWFYVLCNPTYSHFASYVTGWHTDQSIIPYWRSPTNHFVQSSIIPTSSAEMPDDTNYADLLIYVHQDGLHSTTLNGQVVPASAFDSFPHTNREYWVAQFSYYNQDIPPFFKIENPRGFHADLDQIAYHADTANPTRIVVSCGLVTSSESSYEYVDFAHSNLSSHDSATIYRCLGDTLVLDAHIEYDSVPYLWSIDGVPFPGLSAFKYPLLQTGILEVQLILFRNSLCPDTTTTFVRVVLPPVIPFSSDTTLCAGATLSAETPDALLYTWSTGETTPAITIDSAGIYSVTVANRGCTASLDSFRVELYEPSHVDFGQDTTLCNLATLLLDATQTHPATYEWQDHSTNTTYLVVNDGHYWVIVTDHCLGASDTIDVDYLHDFEVNLGTDTTLCEGDELVLSANLPFCTYRWQDGSTEPRFVVRQPGSYSVTATNLCYSHNDDIDIDYEPCAQELWMPNAFTPNGDGLNDRFLPVFSHPDEIEGFEMMVYDRWGSMVFLTKDMHTGWDGGDLPRGMYVWVIRYKSAREEERTVKGSVMVGR